MESVANLEGNKLALEHRPDHLVIASIPIEAAAARLGGRGEKNDNAIFESDDFLKKSHKVYHSEEYFAYFKEKGSQVHLLNTEGNIDIMTKNAKELLSSLLHL